MEDTRRLEGHDLSGRLFHTLLTDAKFTGAYYTSVPAATLLTRLVFHDWPSHVDWSDYEFPASLNVADLACGTGTLLMAVAAEAERRHTNAGGQNAAELHKAMVEQALHGYDVQLSAVHFAATSLAMLNPHIEFDRMNLYVMPLGAEGSRVSLGSLDFLGQDEVPVQYALSSDDMGVGTSEAERVSRHRIPGRGRGSYRHTAGPRPGDHESTLHAVCRRQPAVRQSARRRASEASKRAVPPPQVEGSVCYRRTRRGVRRCRLSQSCDQGEGRLALVLPATVCTGPSWSQTRSLIERDFDLDVVITSHDPMRWNFSDSTDLSEALLIATRRAVGDASTEHRTTFVNLWQNPDGVLDAHRVAQAVTATLPAKIEETGTALLEIDGSHVGEVVSIPASTIAGKKWSGVQFARADLIRSALRLLNDGEVWAPGEQTTV